MAKALGLLYLLTAAALSLYGLNALWLTWLGWRHRAERPRRPQTQDWPQVTVYLPIYNEMHVVHRLLDGVARLDYPRDRLQVLILDDSTDETTDLAARHAAELRREGLNVHLLHREDRAGFKAGALAEATPHTRGEIVVIFDADFVPPRDYLRKVVPHFVDAPRLGCVQTRWGHLNQDYALLTRAQALALDGHFTVEQTARNRAGLFMSFNGTAGAWRQECIEESGGWSADTLCEDLDLSYRAQIRGWQFLFLPEVVAPAELPAQMAAFKRQQFRWARGSIQCLMKLGSTVARAPVPWVARVEGMVHLSSYLVHPLMLLLLLSSLPLLLMEQRIPWPFAFLSLASLGPPLLYAMGQWTLYPRGRLWWRRYRVLGHRLEQHVGGGRSLATLAHALPADAEVQPGRRVGQLGRLSLRPALQLDSPGGDTPGDLRSRGGLGSRAHRQLAGSTSLRPVRLRFLLRGSARPGGAPPEPAAAPPHPSADQGPAATDPARRRNETLTLPTAETQRAAREFTTKDTEATKGGRN